MTAAFIANGLRRIAYGGAIDGAVAVCVFSYVTNDLLSEVLAADYFDAAYQRLNVGDLILASVDQDGTPDFTILRVASIAAGVVAVTEEKIGNSVAGAAAGYKLARGSAALDGSNPTPIATGLATIVSASVTLRGTAAPGDNTSVLTTDYTGSDGTLNVYAWKNTGGTDPTLVASTGTESFDWTAIGT